MPPLFHFHARTVQYRKRRGGEQDLPRSALRESLGMAPQDLLLHALHAGSPWTITSVDGPPVLVVRAPHPDTGRPLLDRPPEGQGKVRGRSGEG